MMYKVNHNGDIEINVNFTYQDLTAMEEFLEAKQQEGLHLVGYHKNRMVFRRCPPSRARYCCEVFVHNRKQKFDENFVAFCVDSGWQFVASNWNGIYIFKTYDETLPRIMTDDQLKLSVISKAFLKNTLMLLVANIVLFAVLSMNAVSFADDMWIFVCTLFQIILSLHCIFDLGYLLLWWKKRKAQIKSGQKMTTDNMRTVERKYIKTLLRLLVAVSAFALISFVISGKYMPAMLFLAVAVVTVLIRSFMGDDNVSNRTKQKLRTAVCVCAVLMVLLSVLLGMILPPIENDTELIGAVEEQFSIKYSDEYLDSTRLSQKYDFYETKTRNNPLSANIQNGYIVQFGNSEEKLKCTVFVSKFHFMRDKYADPILNTVKYRHEKVTEIKLPIDEADAISYYEITPENSQKPSEAIVMFSDYVFRIYEPNQDTAEKMINIFKIQRSK